MTHYVAELHSSTISVKVSKTEGSLERPKRVLNVQVLLGGGAMVCTVSEFIQFKLYGVIKGILGMVEQWTM